MLNSAVLLVGVPMVALLAAAFYVFTRSGAQTASHGRPGAQGHPAYGHASHPGQASSTTVRKRSGKQRQARAPDPNQQADLDSPDSGFPEEDQCEICFEDAAPKVRLYPCLHSDMCVICVNKLLVTNKRECPFCRRRIDGYMDIESRQMYG